MVRYKIPLLLQCLTLLIPLNVYMWGNWLLVNLQWAFVRYQYTGLGSGFIPINRDIDFILLGHTTGIHNILAVLFWTTGGILLLVAFFLTLIASLGEKAVPIRNASFLVFGAGLLFCLSALERFTAGFAIPLGIPLIFITGWITYRQQPEADDAEEDADDESDGSRPEGTPDPE